MFKRTIFLFSMVGIVVGGFIIGLAGSVDLDFEKGRGKDMLKAVCHTIEEKFYDPQFRGHDLEKLRQEAEANIDKSEMAGQIMVSIFQMVHKLGDSHTVFIPPRRVGRATFGFKAKPFGEEIRVYSLDKKGPAAAAGLELGDRLLKVNGYDVDRKTFDLVMTYMQVVFSVQEMELTLSHAGETPKNVWIKGRIKPGATVVDLTNVQTIYELIREAENEKEIFSYDELPGEIGYIHLPSFTDDRALLTDLVKKVKKSKALIVDLRGNPGGAVEGLEHLVGHFEREPTIVAQMIGRKKTEPLKSKPSKTQMEGPFFILVDSETASAAEIFARHFQRKGRAVIIGDQTSGQVSVSSVFSHNWGVDRIVPYAVQVATAQLVFDDGEKLEGRGISPDQLCIPTQEDLKEEQDPCLELAHRLAQQALGISEAQP